MTPSRNLITQTRIFAIIIRNKTFVSFAFSPFYTDSLISVKLIERKASFFCLKTAVKICFVQNYLHLRLV